MLLTPRVVDSSNRVMMHITAVHQPGQTQTHHIVHHSAVESAATHHIVARPVKVDKATQVDVDLENMSKILSGVRTSETIELIPFVDQLGNSLTTLPGTTAIVTSNGTLRLLQQNGATIVGPNSGYVTLAAAPGTLNATHFVTPVATTSPPEEEVEQIPEPDAEPEQLSEQQVVYSSKKQSSSSQSRPYSCDQCNRTFRFIENLQKHIEQGHSEESKPHKCDTCGKRFPHQWNLNRHMQSHTGERPHMCEICNKRFMRAQHLDQHRKVHEGQRYPCDICGKQFTHLRNLQRHKRTHGQKMYACDMCDECFMQPEYLAEHKKLHSNGDYKPDIYTLDATEALHHEDAIHYEQLQAAEPTPEEEQVHIAPATVVTTLPAGAVVSATIPDHQITVHHQQQPHHQHQQEQQVEQDHQGQIMGHHHQGVTVVHQQAATVAVTPAPSTPALEQTVSAAPLVKYKGSSGGSHVCNECGKSFSNPNNLSRHKKNHNAFRPYACGLCDKRFFQVQHLQQHKKCHEGQRYGCEHCGKQFTHPRNLQRHRLIHTGQRPYVCPQCNKAFNQSTHLYKHMNIHQKLPHACRRCGERFRYKTERERHKKAVHSNRDSDGDQKQDYSLTAPVSDSMDDMDDLGDHTDDHMEGLVKLETASSGSSSIPYDGIKMERVELSHARPGSNESYVSYIDDSSSGRETATGTPTSNAGGTTIIAMNYDSKGAITSATIDATALRQAGSSESNGDDQSNSDDIQFQQRYLTHEFISS